MRILVIDDEEMIRALAEKILSRAGHEVLLAESGPEGMNLLDQRSGEIDMAIVDYVMEGMSGVETLRNLRRKAPDLPCLLSSGHTNTADSLPDDLLHKVEFLQKPYRANDLIDKVDTMCRTWCGQP
jgi:two-component system, cell cycle sensor histidine kinase and response regulator CckA